MATENDASRATDGSPKRERVNAAFESWLETHGKNVSPTDETRLQNLREAAHTGDATLVKKHLDEAKEESNWLYTELMKHPGVVEILNELSIMGF